MISVLERSRETIALGAFNNQERRFVWGIFVGAAGC
jgi:hypothetical protein